LPTDRQRRDEALLLDAWQADTRAGLDALMLAPTRNQVAELNNAARATRLDGIPPERETTLSDGNPASSGDVIITRRNNRTLTSGRPRGSATATAGASPPSTATAPSTSRTCAPGPS
jgi:hypothetical protein